MVTWFILLSLALSGGNSPRLNPLPACYHRFVVTSHRGNHVDVPENTIDAIKEAIRVGADYAEIDIRTTKDGRPVIMHDGTVDRMTNGHGNVADLTFDEIEALEVKDSKHANAPLRRVPTFEQILQTAKGKINLYMDIKAVTPQQILPWLHQYRMEKSVIAYLYGVEEIDQWRAGAPHVPIIADTAEMKTPEEMEAAWRAHPYEIFDGGAMYYRKDLVERAHKLGAKVWPDIQNPGESPAQWEPVMALGIDGFQTDHPEMMVKYLKQTVRR